MDGNLLGANRTADIAGLLRNRLAFLLQALDVTENRLLDHGPRLFQAFALRGDSDAGTLAT